MTKLFLVAPFVALLLPLFSSSFGRKEQWLRRKHKIKVRVEKHFSDDYLYQQLGVIRLTHYQSNLPWAKAK